jgi:magnesium transporter
VNPEIRLSAAFLASHPAEAARVLENFPVNRVGRLLVAIRSETAEKILEHISVNFTAECLAVLDPAAASKVLKLVAPELQVDLLRRLELSQRNGLLDLLEPELSDMLRRLLPYGEGTAGAIMDLSFISVTEDTPVRVAIKRVRRARRGPKFYIYVTDSERKLTGVLTLHELIKAPAAVKIDSLMQRQLVSLPVATPVWHVMRSPYWHQYHVLPVINDHGVLLGVLRQKTVRRFEADKKRFSTLDDTMVTLATTANLLSVTALQLLSTLVSIAGGVFGATSGKAAFTRERK